MKKAKERRASANVNIISNHENIENENEEMKIMKENNGVERCESEMPVAK